MLAGDEQEADPVHELQPAQRRHAHVQEHAQDDRVRDEPGRRFNRKKIWLKFRLEKRTETPL